MKSRRSCMPACLSAVALLGNVATVSAQGVLLPGETYTPDQIGPWAIDNYAQRQGQCGAAAVEPLLNMISADMAPVETTYVLLSVLERHASRLTIKQLRVIVGLCEPGVSKVSGALKASADTAKVQQLARFELIRRGIMF